MTDKRRCTGTAKSTGERCKKPPLPGATVCKTHGGGAPQVIRKAAERVAEQEALKIMEKYEPQAPPVEDPITALLGLAGEITHFKNFLGARVSEMRAQEWRFTDDKGAEQLRAEIALYERALDRTARVLSDLVKLKLEERQVRVAEQQGVMLAEVIRRTADALLLAVVGLLTETAAGSGAAGERLAAGLDAAVRAAWPGWLSTIVPREISAVTSGGES
ncbi:hypothetical protein [Microbispora rosea]|uniref:hypothetical protein n=1 Tax=Microbispora rosea TaxID=58117 RepID=UPI0037AB210A